MAGCVSAVTQELACSGMILLGLSALLFISGCAERRLPHRNPAESFDQANLKKNDSGCPTAIFTAPNGNLEQCP